MRRRQTWAISNAPILTANSNLLDARPSVIEARVAWYAIVGLVVGCLLTIPIAHTQWASSNLMFSLAGISAFVQIATGVLLLTQALILRNDAVLALAVGYLLGGIVVATSILLATDVATKLWIFRVWHSVFILSILVYALLSIQSVTLFVRRRFYLRVKYGVSVAAGLALLLIGFLIYRPFALPQIILDANYDTPVTLWINGVQLLLIAVALVILVKTPRKTVLTTWTTVVATAIFIDIILFVLGGRLFSAGLYISKLSNLIAVTLLFGVIFYHYVRIQRELLRNRVWLLRANRRLNRQALSDPLTSLPNRAALDTYLDFALSRAQRGASLLAVCVIDLDEFKPVNDQYGHQMGDRLLHLLARRLSGILRQNEFLARLGGDEFVLVLEGVPDISTLNLIMARVSAEIEQPFILQEGVQVQVHASIGIALYPQITAADALMRMADRALYRAKADKSTRPKNWHLHLSEPEAS